MKNRIAHILENRLFQETTIAVFAFILFTMNDWMLISSWRGFWKACGYFMILYIHAQMNQILLQPILFKKQKPTVYILSSIALLLVFAGILKVATQSLYENCFIYNSVKQHTYLYHIATMVATFICIVGPSMFLKSYRAQKKQSSETILSKEMQLNSLRSQLNPHFLFNTFNTLYGISLQYPERTPDLILQVSQLMRYQLESNSKKMVKLDEELAFIDSYIKLEKERVGHRCDIRYISNVPDTSHYQIAPMLLIAFIENAFKHGSCALEKCYVRVIVDIRDDKLVLNVTNSIPERKNKVLSTKIGLKNTTERLNILYPDNYNLNIHQGEKEFVVNLELQLA